MKTRTSEDLPLPWVMGAWLVIFLLIGLFKSLNLIGFTGAFLAVFFSFFFVTVASRIVGIVGTSSMPLSGMTIGALLVTCLVVRASGLTGAAGTAAALVISAMICIAIAMGGDISQDLKIGYIVGASPKWVQITQILSVLVCSAVVCQVVSILAPQIINGDLKAPQANLMLLVGQGIVEGNLPWVPIFIGMGIAACVEMMGIGSLPFAVGLYLPLDLSTTLVFGGLIHWVYHKVTEEKLHKKMYDQGILLCSGMVAGDAITGLIMAGLSARAVEKVEKVKAAWYAESNGVACFAFSLLVIFLIVGIGRYVKKERARLASLPVDESDESTSKG